MVRAGRQGAVSTTHLAFCLGATSVARVEWRLVVLAAEVTIVIVVHDNWSAYPVWWRASERLRLSEKPSARGSSACTS